MKETRKKGPTLNYQTFDTDKLTLTLMGDEHIGSKFYDEEYHKEILDWCLENNSPIILMGDELECATRDSVGAGVYEQDEIIDKQIEHFYDLYRPLAEKGLILGQHMGNHEARVWKSSGVNLTKIMSRELGHKDFDIGKAHYIKVGDQGYTMYTAHGDSGARMPHTKIQAALRMSDMIDVEIYASGHVHQLSHHIRNFYDIDKRSKTIKEKQKHFIITGSYLTHWGSYAHAKNYEPSRKGSPKVKLSGLEHRIRVSL